MKESGGHAVKLEGGSEIVESVVRIQQAGIPVMGHLGLTPQSIYKFGTYSVRAKEQDEATKLLEDAKALEDAGCFSIVFEKIPAELAKKSVSTYNSNYRNRCRSRLRWPSFSFTRYARDNKRFQP
jgi:3-methyl-2-oxobutanoate hydroxymethyltransferase